MSLENLFVTGRIVDIMLLFVVLEAALLGLYRYRYNKGAKTAPLMITIAAGASLMLALRATLKASAWPVVAGWLLAAMMFHVIDLTSRLKDSARRDS